MNFTKGQKSSLDVCWIKFIRDLQFIAPESEIEAWVNNLVLEDISSEKITFGGLNRFFAGYVKDNYLATIKKLVYSNFQDFIELSSSFDVSFFLSSKNYTPSLEKNNVIQNSSSLSTLNSKNSFQNFVNGSNTNIAFAASLAISENIDFPKYNPLFICGAVGLGKTHLMQAIGINVLEKNPQKKVLYTSAEGFTNSVIEGIRFSKIFEMKRRYRTLDLLLIDDIQFLENKFSTQEEFFHTLNELVLNNKQVVITSDRFPREMKNIEERLISRFSAGMVSKIDPPDFETRLSIVKNEVSLKNLAVSNEILEHIAYTVKSNVRDIKGIINTLEAESSLLGLEMTLDSVRTILKDFLDLDKSPKSMDDITKVVTQALNVKKSDILSEKRERDISTARQMAMYIVRETTDLSFPVIGRYFDKNHTSVIQSCKKIKIMLKENSKSRQLVQSLIRKIESI